MHLRQDLAYLLPGCPDWEHPPGREEPSTHSRSCQGKWSHPTLRNTVQATPKPMFCSGGSQGAFPARLLPTARQEGSPPGKSMVVSSSGDSSKLRMDRWNVLLQLDCRWL